MADEKFQWRGQQPPEPDTPAPSPEPAPSRDLPVDESGKKHSNFFAAVRARGILNTMLDEPVRKFEASNPGWRARWEYCPPSGDKTLIVAREGMGFRIVDAKELGEATPSGQKEGPIRVGDLILMAAESHIVAAIEMDDAKAAFEDYKLPEESYREHIRGIKARLRDGTEKPTQPVGGVRTAQEEIRPPREFKDYELETEGQGR